MERNKIKKAELKTFARNREVFKKLRTVICIFLHKCILQNFCFEGFQHLCCVILTGGRNFQRKGEIYPSSLEKIRHSRFPHESFTIIKFRTWIITHPPRKIHCSGYRGH